MATKSDKHWLDPPDWWKKWKPLRWIAAGGLLVLGYSTYWGTKTLLQPSGHPETARYVATEPGVPFTDGLASFETIENATARIARANKQWTQTPQHKPESDRYPPRDLDTVTVADYEHLKTPGELRLEFFNNRLFEVTFVPKDPAPYSKRLHAAIPRLKVDRNGKSELVQGSLRIASNVDHTISDVGRAIRAEPYVIWQDLRLLRQRAEWEESYGAIAVIAK